MCQRIESSRELDLWNARPEDNLITCALFLKHLSSYVSKDVLYLLKNEPLEERFVRVLKGL